MTLEIHGPLWGPRFLGLLRELLPLTTTAGLTSNAHRSPGDWLSRAETHLLTVRELTEWPATISLSPVRHYTFQYSSSFVELLWQQCRNPYRLQERCMPDNLHCLGPSGQVTLGTNTCNRSAWTQLTGDQWVGMVRRRPVLASLRVSEPRDVDSTTPDGQRWPGWLDPWVPA